jgi:hypothetical protein
MHHPHRQVTVVGEQHQAATAQVQASNRKKPATDAQPIGHGRPALRITHTGEHPDRFVHHQVGPAANRLDDLTVDGDPIDAGRDLETRCRAAAIDGDMTGGDQRIRLAPCRDAGAG